MPIRLTQCDNCPAQFRVKEFNKQFIGMYKDKPVFHWNYVCPVCNHVHTVRNYNEFVNTYFDKVISMEFSLLLNRKDEEKYKKLSDEYKIAKDELEKVNEEVRTYLFIKVNKCQ
ncbi:hypothetical protein [Neobacillus cucumis]|uniref:Uncharacterized protein n=1 Tax=Neobacillus cucumis TaxID=1740721 RepID=A0A2N5HES2_9BACI|nr:hypothetical protein [Neobacillus cucumis]PLS04034.1 hypothetical protein CVD27_12810 [Neobacillus cucumis]